MCVLCRDTFSRSDILKRHFQKCSIRRGNPTGASHLSHPHAHVKKAQKAMMEGDMNGMGGIGGMPSDNMGHAAHPFGLIPAPSPGGMPSMPNDQHQLSRSNSLQDGRDRRDVGGSAEYSNGNVQNNLNNPNINPQLANYSMPTAQNGLQMFAGQNPQQQSGLDWSSMFPSGAQEQPYTNTFTPPNDGQTQIALKREPNVDAVRTDGNAGGTHENFDRSLFFGNDWGSQYSANDPYQTLSNQLLNFFTPPSHAESNSQAATIRSHLSPDNIKDFLDSYSHFHVHFALLHIPTFRIMEAYTGLLASMCCVGACYSSRVSADDVRHMTDFLVTALERDSRMLASLNDVVQIEIKYENGAFGTQKQHMEELQAIILMHTLLVWNGTPQQREKARKIFPLLAAFARKAELLTVSASPTLFSQLHQPELSPDVQLANREWLMWMEQEKRIRLMSTIFACDVALGLYFNAQPLFDPLEIRLPLPADDAAWEARDAQGCAEALGLVGPQLAAARNPYGTQRAKQPEMHLAVRALLQNSYQMQPKTTNLYGKFLLIHALLALIRRCHAGGHAILSTDFNPQLAQSDWVEGGHDSGIGGSQSGQATPVDGSMSSQWSKTLAMALQKFKRTWDSDMANQFPPASTNPRRLGFSRDGIHYYWLANYLLKNTRPADLQTPPDQRFTQVIHLLKSVKSWVMSDGASRGEELGSIGEIDQNYGVQNLTLDMVNLFKPVPTVVESADIPSVHTDINIGSATRGML